MFKQIIPTMLVGSYPQPSWLVDRAMLLQQAPPRVRMRDVWRPPAELLTEAQDDAALTALNDQERAGIDVVGDGEVRRESYFNAFANALDGIDLDNPGTVPGRTGLPTLVPRVVGPIRHGKPVLAQEVAYLKQHTCKPIKITLPGAFTMAKMALDEFYGDQEALIMDYAKAINAELHALKDLGADVVQIDEPHMQAHPKEAARFAIQGINAALQDIPGPSIVHLCFGYAYVVKDKPSGYSFLPELEKCAADAISIEAAQPGLDPAILRKLPSKIIMYGVIDLADAQVESAEQVAERLRGALQYVGADRLIAAPDCGMKYLPRATAFGKLKALVGGARLLRRELKVGEAASEAGS